MLSKDTTMYTTKDKSTCLELLAKAKKLTNGFLFQGLENDEVQEGFYLMYIEKDETKDNTVSGSSFGLNVPYDALVQGFVACMLEGMETKENRRAVRKAIVPLMEKMLSHVREDLIDDNSLQDDNKDE